MKRSIWIIVSILVMLGIFVGIFAYINQEKLIDRFILRQSKNIEFNYDILKDSTELQIVTVGTSSVLPSGRAQSCIAVIIKGRLWLFDTGKGAMTNLERFGLPLDRIESVFISQWNAEKFIDLPSIVNRSWFLGRHQEMQLYGPPGVYQVVEGLDSMLYFERTQKLKRYGVDVLSPTLAKIKAFPIIASQGPEVIWEDEHIQVDALPLFQDDSFHSFAFKIAVDSQQVVIANWINDTEAFERWAKDVDILFMGVQNDLLMNKLINHYRDIDAGREAMLWQAVSQKLVSTQDAARFAQKVGASKLVFSTLTPTPENPVSRRIFTHNLEDYYEKALILAEDGDVFTLAL